MNVFHRVLSGTYRDSVALLALSTRLSAQPGIERAAVLTGTEANKSLFAQAGLLDGPLLSAGPNDLCIAVLYGSPASEAGVASAVEAGLAKSGSGAHVAVGGASTAAPRSLRAASEAAVTEPRLAVVSVPGAFAAAEAGKALHLGMDVFLFSNGVALEDEVALKGLAQGLGRLVMGPDAGTALLEDMPLGFCNAWPAGPVGIVAASGTGAQEVASQLARAGCGVNEIVGTGSLDLSREVGGVSFRAGLRRLAADPATEVLVLISKPPDPEVLRTLAPELARVGKPCVALFLSRPGERTALPALPAGVIVTGDTDEAVRAVLARAPVAPGKLSDEELARAEEYAGGLAPGRRWIRGLFSGGTLAKQAAILTPDCREAEAPSWTAADPVKGALAALEPACHQVLDMGEDAFTVGRPHPIVDPDLRAQVLRSAARLPDTAVVLFDVVLGALAHPDPAGVLAEAVGDAPGPVYVASVCGTDGDPQSYSAQCAKLRAAGVWVAETSPQAARAAAAVTSGVG